MRDGFFDWWAIAADASMSAALLRQRRSTFDELAAELGTVVLPLDDWTHVPDVDLPWRGPVGTWERRYLPIHAIGACYVIVALLSGMRDSEVTDLKRGCLRATLREDGTTKGYEVSGRIYKGDKRRVEGREHTWVVIEPVAKAIGALERLSSCLNELGWHPLGDASDGADLLFWSNASRSERRALTGKQSLDYVRTFVEQCRSSVAYMCRGQSEEKIREIRALYEIPPGDNGLPWRFETRQFRRTLAWYIARQPFGIIAGMLQFGHASAIIFEGYAGQSASGFRDEIAEFELLGQLEDITEDFERWQGGTDPQGPMGKRLKSEFERIEAELGDLPGQVVDEDRRNKMLRNVALTLHPGFINDCFYYPEHALCRHGVDGDARGPVLSACRPLKCPNSSIAPRHRPALEECLEHTTRELQTPGLTAFQRGALEGQVELYQELLGMIVLDAGK